MRLWPLPRAVQLLLVPLLALASLAPFTVGASLVPDALAGSATVTTFQFFANGMAVEGGAFDWTDVCRECWLRMTLTGTGIHVVDATHPDGSVRTLAPGQYELREYRGLIGIHDIAPHHFVLWLEGAGKVIKLS